VYTFKSIFKIRNKTGEDSAPKAFSVIYKNWDLLKFDNFSSAEGGRITKSIIFKNY
jgi:hypothetical protein